MEPFELIFNESFFWYFPKKLEIKKNSANL